MLNSDMVLGYNVSVANAYGVLNQACGPYSPQGAFNGCLNPTDQTVPNTVATVQGYISSNANFLSAFSTSFQKLLSVGYGTGSSKLGGPLTSLDLSTC